MERKINGEQGTALPYKITVRSPLGNYNIKVASQVSPMDTKISEWKLERKQGICTASKNISQDMY